MEEISNAPPRDMRYWADFAAIFVHLALVIAIPLSNPGDHWGNAAGIILISMQCLTIFFHVQYTLLFMESEWSLRFLRLHDQEAFFSQETNKVKWLEYSVSATMGTLALYFSSDAEYNPDIVFLLISLAISEQTVGFMLDEDFANTPLRLQLVQWASAFLGQVAEFTVVGRAIYSSSDPNLAGYWSYVTCWSLFGMWALRNIIKRNNDDSDIPVAETGYSLLSTISKGLVFAFTGLHLK